MLNKEQPRTLSESEQKALRSAGIYTNSEEVEAIEQKHAELYAMRKAKLKQIQDLIDEKLEEWDPDSAEKIRELRIKQMRVWTNPMMEYRDLPHLPNETLYEYEARRKFIDSMKGPVNQESESDRRELFILKILKWVAV